MAPVSLALRRLTGSWGTQFVLGAIAWCLCGVWYGPLYYRTAARTLFLRPYLAHFCSFLRHLFAVLSVLTPGIQKVAPKDRGPVA